MITSACHECTHDERKCEVLVSTSSMITSMMADVDLLVLMYLSRCENQRDYVARITRGVGGSYMTVKRSLRHLISIRLVRAIDERDTMYQYYRLSSFGAELVTIIQRD
jgi:hypothetical protein